MLLKKSNQKGNSLLEAMAVVTIISMLSISAFKIISGAYGMFKMSMATTELKDLQKAISGIYNYSGTYKDLFEDDVYKTLCETDKSAPNQMCIKNGSDYVLRHRLGGYVELASSDDFKSYKIIFNGLTKKNCVEFTQIDWLDRKKITIYQIDINGSEVAYFPKRGEKGFPISSTTSFAGCNKKDGDNAITWYFY